MIACTHISLAQYSGVLLSARSTQLTWEDFSTFQHRTATLTFPPLSSRFTPSLSSGAVPPAAVLWASASTMNDKLELPSKLLSLPNELWHHIMSSTQIAENPIRGFAALANKERSLSLRNASLAHRILQPFAQEELLRILHIDSHDSLWMLLETLEGSDRLAGYAKRMVAIRLIRNDNKCYFNVILDDGILKRLSKLCTNVRELDVYAVNRFNLSEVSKSLVTLRPHLIPADSVLCSLLHKVTPSLCGRNRVGGYAKTAFSPISGGDRLWWNRLGRKHHRFGPTSLVPLSGSTPSPPSSLSLYPHGPSACS